MSGALTRAIALHFQDSTLLTAGDNLVLGISPKTTATTRELSLLREASERPTEAQAFARGIGAGNSRFLSDLHLELTEANEYPLNHFETDHGDKPANIFPEGRFTGTGIDTSVYGYPIVEDDPDLYNTQNLRIDSGGGAINGTAEATSYVSGRGNTYSNAEAIQIGLANIEFRDRFGKLLEIGSEAAPLTAQSLAINDSLLGDVRGSQIIANNKSTAIVRGLEGGQVTDDSGKALNGYEGNIVYGQPLANVAAKAAVDHRTESGFIETTYITADAKGLEDSTIYNVPLGSGNGVATMGGTAVSNATFIVGSGWDRLDPADAGRVEFTNQPTGDNPNLQIISQAIGVDASSLYGAPTLNSSIQGSGLATVDLISRNNHVIDPTEVDRENVVGIGIRDSEIYTNRGDDLIAASGGAYDGGIYLGNRFNHLAGTLDAAGFDNTNIYTNEGNDRILGVIMSEVDAGIDANNNGVFDSDVYLDQGALDPYKLNGYDGFRLVKVDAGLGDDLIRGSSNTAMLYGSSGEDSIVLDRAKDTALWGGADDDYLEIIGNVRGDINLWGDIGNDIIVSGKASDSIFNLQTIDGGYGQDLLYGNNDSIDNFLLGNAGASLSATSSDRVNKALTSPEFWSRLTDPEKDLLWKEGVLLGAQTATVQQQILSNPLEDGSLTSNGTEAIRNIDVINNFEAGPWRDTVEVNSSLANLDEATWKSEGTLFTIGEDGELDAFETSANHPNRIGVILGSLEEISSLGKASPSIAYSSDTRQLLYDADGDWSRGTISMGVININNGESFNHSNIRFGSKNGEGMSTPISL